MTSPLWDAAAPTPVLWRLPLPCTLTAARSTRMWRAFIPPDPRKVSNTRKLEEITFDEMLELASLGAQVLNNRSVELAKSTMWSWRCSPA